MKRLLVFAAVLSLALTAFATSNISANDPPGREPCSHDGSGKACRADPQPNRGKDCEDHGRKGGDNEDHCGTPTRTPKQTPSYTPRSTVTPTSSSTPTSTPSATPTATPVPSASGTPTPTATPVVTPTSTPVVTPIPHLPNTSSDGPTAEGPTADGQYDELINMAVLILKIIVGVWIVVAVLALLIAISLLIKR